MSNPSEILQTIEDQNIGGKKAGPDPMQYCWEHYPEMMEEFERLQLEDKKTFCEKQMDYGPGNIKMGTDLATEDDKRLSLTGLVVRMNDKIQRLMHLVVVTRRAPQNESIEDAFKDSSVYGIIARLVINNKWGK